LRIGPYIGLYIGTNIVAVAYDPFKPLLDRTLEAYPGQTPALSSTPLPQLCNPTENTVGRTYSHRYTLGANKPQLLVRSFRSVVVLWGVGQFFFC